MGKGNERMTEEIMTLDELKQIAIDNYVNLMRIKKAEKSENEELEYQIKIATTKLNALGISLEELKCN